MTIDAIMCCLWMLTYTLVLVGTVKHKYPLISPITQLIIAPFEFAVLFKLINDGTLRFDYVLLSYVYWTIIEVVLIVTLIRYAFVPKRYVAAYLSLMVIITLIMCYLVAYKGHYFFFSYFSTFVGEIIWLIHINKKNYPMKPIVLAVFLAKFIGDAMSIPVYWGRGSWIIDFICVALPILDFLFIHTYFSKVGNTPKTHQRNASPK